MPVAKGILEIGRKFHGASVKGPMASYDNPWCLLGLWFWSVGDYTAVFSAVLHIQWTLVRYRERVSYPGPTETGVELSLFCKAIECLVLVFLLHLYQINSFYILIYI